MDHASAIDEVIAAPSHALPIAIQAIRSAPHLAPGAIIEYELFRRSSRPELPPLRTLRALPAVNRIDRVLDNPDAAHMDITLKPRFDDTIRIPSEFAGNHAWVAFLKRADLSAREAGFSQDVAAGLAGAIWELADNVLQHSQASTDGVVAYCRKPHSFEYAVGDSGIGILASLRSANEFRSLRDDIEALPLAMIPGVSRHGRGLGFGYGFRAVLLPLNAVSGEVRLRSGKASLTISGQGLNQNEGICVQRPAFHGVVVSVRLNTNKL